MSGSGWIGVDFDGTLAHYGTWVGAAHVGDPIAPMVDRVRRWLAEGRDVRVFTARLWPIAAWKDGQPLERIRGDWDETEAQAARYAEAHRAAQAIDAWCSRHLGRKLPITCVKDFSMIELWDDRAVQVRPNTGEVVGSSTRGLW